MDRRSRVLVVDDERPIQDLLKAMLGQLGYEVDSASSGAEALAKLNDTHDAVLLDLMMAGMDGFQVARAIRQGGPYADIPICMVTGHSGREHRLQAVEAGANDFITKPFDRTELSIRIGALVRAKGSRDTIKAYQARLEDQNHALRENNEQLEKAVELKDEFLRIASHDLKNPLTCIIGFATLVESSIQPGQPMTETAHGMLRRIIQRASSMEKTIRDFLEMQVLEDGFAKLARGPIDMNDTVRAAMQENSGYAMAKGIALDLELAEELPPAEGDISHIPRILDNLVGNAIKFGRRGDQVVLRTSRDTDSVIVEIRDTGPGLTADDLSKLFTKYARLSNKPTGDEESTGLGLAICRKLIRMNSGDIGARNNNDSRGCTFWFKLPVATFV